MKIINNSEKNLTDKEKYLNMKKDKNSILSSYIKERKKNQHLIFTIAKAIECLEDLTIMSTNSMVKYRHKKSKWVSIDAHSVINNNELVEYSYVKHVKNILLKEKKKHTLGRAI